MVPSLSAATRAARLAFSPGRVYFIMGVKIFQQRIVGQRLVGRYVTGLVFFFARPHQVQAFADDSLAKCSLPA